MLRSYSFYFMTSILISFAKCDCVNLETSIIQKVENEGFHRNLKWLIEISSKSLWSDTGCKLSLQLQLSSGMFINPDEVAELNRTGKLKMHIDKFVDIEIPAHEAKEHTVYIFLNESTTEKTSVSVPFHLRYQRGQIGGGYGKVILQKPSLLIWCSENVNKVCWKGLKVEAPCDETAHETCIWTNQSYQALFDEVELFVPVGNLDDYPLVSIVTLMLGCAGCIYILSVLSTTSL